MSEILYFKPQKEEQPRLQSYYDIVTFTSDFPINLIEEKHLNF